MERLVPARIQLPSILSKNMVLKQSGLQDLLSCILEVRSLVWNITNYGVNKRIKRKLIPGMDFPPGKYFRWPV